MPTQTTNDAYIYFPDGAKVSVKESGAGSYTDIGVLGSAITLTFNYDENEYVTANAGQLAKQIKNMTVAGTFDLINLDPDNIERLGAGLFENVETTAATVVDANFTDQSIVGYTAGVAQDLLPVVTATGVTIKFSDTPVITSVEASSSGTLDADDDYFVIADANSVSGYKILFNGSGTHSPGTGETYTIDFGDNDPVANNTLYIGSSTATLSAYQIKFTHTDSDSVIDREVEVFSAEPNSGGFQFNFLGANEDGVEVMPISFTGKIDASLTDGRQLMSILQTIKT